MWPFPGGRFSGLHKSAPSIANGDYELEINNFDSNNTGFISFSLPAAVSPESSYEEDVKEVVREQPDLCHPDKAKPALIPDPDLHR